MCWMYVSIACAPVSDDFESVHFILEAFDFSGLRVRRCAKACLAEHGQRPDQFLV